MKRPTFIALLLFILAGMQPALMGTHDDKPFGVLTLRLTVTIRAQMSQKLETSSDSDNITVSYSENDTYAITRLPDPESNGGLDLQSFTPILSAGGGGNFESHINGEVSKRAWGYTVAKQPEQTSAYVKVDFTEGTVDFTALEGVLDCIRSTSSIPEADCGALLDAGMTATEAFLDGQFRQQLVGHFAPNAKSFAVAGSASYRVSPKGAEANTVDSGTITVGYTITYGGAPDTEAVIETPGGYDIWRPDAGLYESFTAGPRPLTVKVHLKKKGDPKAPAQHKAQFKFILVGTTHEPGTCMNFPPEPKTTPDLKISQASIGNGGAPLNSNLRILDDDGQQAETLDKDLNESQVTISSYDWGGSARLQVTAILEDGTSIIAHLDTDNTKTELKIPQDENNNGIADCWERWNNHGALMASPPNADDDLEPKGDGDSGDGLTVYEEYRGFIVKGEHISTNPKKKDFFVCDTTNKAEGGIKLLQQLTHFEVHRLSRSELGPDRIINRNHGSMPHEVEQHGVIIVPGEDGLVSEATYVPGTPEGIMGTPKSHLHVEIGLGFLAGDYPARRLDQCVAHELLHCCNVWHHGDSDLGFKIVKSAFDSKGFKYLCIFDLDKNGKAVEKGGPIIVVLEETGKRSGSRLAKDDYRFDKGFLAWIGTKHGQHSGDTDCVMRYNCAKGYINGAGEYVFFGDAEKVGMRLCQDPRGTGVNDKDRGVDSRGAKLEPRYGDADGGKGNCLNGFCVNDKYH